MIQDDRKANPLVGSQVQILPSACDFMQKAIDFLKNTKKDVGIFFDSDPDGTCSAALMLAYFKQRKIRAKLFTGDLDKNSFIIFSRKKVSMAVFLDFALDSYPDFLKGFGNKRTLIIDHHPISNDLNKLGFVYVNPRFKNPNLYISTSHFCFDILEKAGMKNFDWLYKIGDVGDHVIRGNIYEKEVVRTISAAKAVKGNEILPKIAEILSESKNINEFLENKEFNGFKEIFFKEIKSQLDTIKKSRLQSVNFIEIKSKYSITSVIASIVLDLYPDKTFIIFDKKKGFYHVSGRTYKFDIGKIFKKASKGIGHGGGHENAAGARIMVKDFKIFKQRILSFIYNLR